MYLSGQSCKLQNAGKGQRGRDDKYQAHLAVV